MKCPKCGVENSQARKFCKTCGAKLILPCPECGFENDPDDQFCGGCGHSLTPAPAPLLDHSKPHSYTPKFLADKILTTRSSIEGERKLVTVLFADVANFTTISEKLDPEEIHGIMDGAFRILMDEIHKYEGTINQFTGDGVMALFGAPLSHEDHAIRACHAALAIQDSLARYSQRLKEERALDFRMRIGLNSGSVVVGAIGDDLRMDYTAIGDTINLASRMEGLASPGTVLVSRNTHRLTRDFFTFSPLGKVRVKGKQYPQEAFILLSPSGVETRLTASVAKGSLTPFVGREHSMASLMEAHNHVKEGSGQVVEVVGEAGVGKSRLLLEFRSLIPQDEATYLEGRCLHFGASMAYLPLLDILRSYFGIKEGDNELVIKSTMKERVDPSLLPPLQDLLSLQVEDEHYLKLEPKEKKDRIFEALRDLFIKLCQERTLILAIEDLHWIDKTTEEFLDYLMGWLTTSRMLLILLHRPEYTHPWGSRSYFNRIGLTQLTMKSSSELVQAILEGKEVAPELSDLILSRASGNPLFMEELCHSLLENGSIQMRDQKYVLSPATYLEVPDTIQGIIAARMDRLEENLKRIMQVASVIGREFAFRILQAISGMREDVKVNLLDLQRLELIYEKSLFPELEYIFKHALIQEVAYNSLLLKRRKDIHERIGKAIEQLYQERLEEFYEMLAYHYTRGEDLGKAGRYLTLSGNKAARRNSLWEAYSFYKEALAALHRLPETEERKKEQLDVLVLAATPLHLLGYPEGCLDMLQEGEALAKELRDNRHLSFFYGRLSGYHSYRGNHVLGVKYSEDAFQEGQKSEDIELIVPAAFGLSNSYVGTGQFNKLVAMARGVLDLLEKKEREADFFGLHTNPYAYFSGYCGVGLGWMGNFMEAEPFFEKGLRQATGIGDLRAIALVEFVHGFVLHMKGDWKASAEHYQKSVGYSEKVKFLSILSWGWGHLGNIYAYLGDPEMGRSYGEKGLKTLREAGVEWFLSLEYLYLGDTHLQLGDLENARGLVEEALRLSRKNNEKFYEATALIFLGRILGRAETPQILKAEECVLQGMKIADELKAKPAYAQGHLFLGELYAHGGQKEKALENLTKAETMFQEMGMDYWLAVAREVLAGV
jgi:class 3 adenylate cyclase/tetratricopeptide (TPR) repeat protein